MNRPVATESFQALATQLVAEHLKVVYAYALRLTGSAHEAEDLTQETFLRACQHLHQLRQPQRARVWLLAIVRNCYLQQCRLRSQEREIPQADWSQWPQEEPQEGPWDWERLQEALNELPQGHRVVLLMYYFEQLSYCQIAQELKIPVGTVMSRLSRAKARLRKILLQRDPALAK